MSGVYVEAQGMHTTSPAGRKDDDDRLDAELRDHVERHVAHYLARGMTEEDARRQVRLELGGLEQAKEACREVRPFRWAEEFLRDVRLGLRALRREPLLAISVVLILSLGIGTSVTMFSVLNAVVLRPLPYGRPGELVRLTTQLIAQDRPDGTSLANLADWRTQSRTFADMTYYRRALVSTVTFAGLEAPQRALEGLVGPEFFALLETPPLIGRPFSREEFEQRERVVVLSEGLWREQFAGSPAAIGRTVQIDGQDHVVVGVMPRTFQLPTSETRFWRPLSVLPLWPAAQSVRDSDQFEVLGRLKPGVTVDQAGADLRVVAARLRDAHAVNRNLDIRLEPLADYVVGARVRRGVWLAFGAVLCLLLIACANVGGLLLARMAKRRRELAVRTALGAGRPRLVRQLLAEAVSLWAIASVAAVFLAYLLVRTLLAVGPRTLPRIGEAGLDALSLAIAFGGSLVVVIVCGAVPALFAARTDATTAFGSRDASAPPRTWPHDVLVGVQIAGALALLVGAVLFAQSFLRAQGEDPGYPAGRLLVVRLNLPRAAYPDVAAASGFFQQARERIGALPGVEAVGGITDFFIRRNADQWVTVKGLPAGRAAGAPRLAIEGVTPGFFHATGIDLIEGRDFEDRDYEPGAPGVFIVSESLARRFWPGESALGKQMVSGELPPKDGRWRTVVGVVKDFRREGRDVAPILGAFTPTFPRVMDLTIRASTRVDHLVPAVRRELGSIDDSLPVNEVITADGRLSERLEARRFQSQALTAFSAMALLLSAAGLYASLAYQVALRRREIGVRTALGATRRAIVSLVLAKALRIAIAGTAAGVLTAATAATAIRSLLYATPAISLTSYAGAAAFVLFVALTAAALPAFRASRMDPMRILRED
jgi:predicted permease